MKTPKELYKESLDIETKINNLKAELNNRGATSELFKKSLDLLNHSLNTMQQYNDLKHAGIVCKSCVFGEYMGMTGIICPDCNGDYEICQN